MLILDFNEPLDAHGVAIIRRVLEQDGVLVYPTDTLYGIGGHFLSPETGHKIDTLKQRSDMPYSAAVSSIAMIRRLSEHIPPVFYSIYELLLPGKFTFLFQAHPQIPKILLKNSPKIGIRVPGPAQLLQLIDDLDMPLISTSVNRSGSPPLNDPGLIKKEFPQVDILLDAGVLPESKGSTILDLTQEPIKLIRRGDDFSKLAAAGIEVATD